VDAHTTDDDERVRGRFWQAPHGPCAIAMQEQAQARERCGAQPVRGCSGTVVDLWIVNCGESDRTGFVWALFSWQKLWFLATVALSFLFDKHCLIMK